MITAIEIENFKAIGKRQRIELRPITLLFGPNSAGKSTVFDALHYVREVLDLHNLDPHKPVAGGNLIDLGGFSNVVYARQLERCIQVRLDTNVWPEGFSVGVLADQDDQYPLYWLLGRIRTAWVEFHVGWDTRVARPFVSRYEVGVNGQRVGVITKAAGAPESILAELEWDHPIFDWSTPLTRDPVPDIVDELLHARSDAPAHKSLLQLLYDAYKERTDSPLLEGSPLVRIPGDPIPDPEADSWAVHDADATPHAESDPERVLMVLLFALFSRPLKHVIDQVRHHRYLGPMRQKPNRAFTAERFTRDANRIASGLVAWDVLAAAPTSYVERVNEFLHLGEHSLKTGYTVHRRLFKEVDVAGPLMLALEAGRVFEDVDLLDTLKALPTRAQVMLRDESSMMLLHPEDVGEGIAQVVPVVVSVLDEESDFVMVEEPESQVHPRIQTNLGDLLLCRARRNDELAKARDGEPIRWPAVLLIESHSEHLLLRLLRRVRETSSHKLPPNAWPATTNDIAVYYLEPGAEGVTIKPLRIDDTGEFLDPWPDGFFEERGEELFG